MRSFLLDTWRQEVSVRTKAHALLPAHLRHPAAADWHVSPGDEGGEIAQEEGADFADLFGVALAAEGHAFCVFRGAGGAGLDLLVRHPAGGDHVDGDVLR